MSDVDARASHKSLFLRNAKWAFAAMVLRYGVSFVVTMFLGKALGAASFGQYQYYLSVYAIVEALSMVFNYTVIQNELISGRVKFEQVWGTLRIVSPIINVMTILVLVAWAVFSGWNDVDPKLLGFLHLALFFKLGDLLSIELAARLNQHRQQMSDIVTILIFNLSRLAVLALGGGVAELVLCTVLQSALSCTFLMTLYVRDPKLSLHGRFDPVMLKTLLRRSLPMYGVAVMSVILGRVVNLLLPEMMTQRDLGVYAFASKLIDPVVSVGLLPFMTAMPFLSHSYHDSPTLFRDRAARVLSVTLIVSLVIFVATLVVPLRPVLAWINPDFPESASLLPILALTVVGQAFSALCNLSDVLAQKFSRALVRYLLLVSGQLLMLFILIRADGLRGAALAVLLSPMLINLLYNSASTQGRLMNALLLSRLRPRAILASVTDLRDQLQNLWERRR